MEYRGERRDWEREREKHNRERNELNNSNKDHCSMLLVFLNFVTFDVAKFLVFGVSKHLFQIFIFNSLLGHHTLKIKIIYSLQIFK